MKKCRVSKPKSLHEVIECCQHIITLSGLLAQCGQIHRAELIEPKLVGNAGSMIAAESQFIEQFLEYLVVRSHATSNPILRN